ncbi:MAG: hypothetical protein ACE5I1_11720 [bacterium]
MRRFLFLLGTWLLAVGTLPALGQVTLPNRITAQKMERDFNWRSEDNFEIIIDSYHDKRNGYLFVTNPNGALADVLVLDNGRQLNRDWDGIWNVATRIEARGCWANCGKRPSAVC